MPKGNTTITTGYTTFHRCVCGYDIEDVSKKLIDLKKKLHRKKCQEWKKEDVVQNNVGILDLPRGMNQHQVNRDENRERNEVQMMLNFLHRNGKQLLSQLQ
jgi:hypothetical protein